MLRLLADQNFNEDIISGLLDRRPGLDVIRAWDVGLQAAKDPGLLAWARKRTASCCRTITKLSRTLPMTACGRASPCPESSWWKTQAPSGT